MSLALDARFASRFSRLPDQLSGLRLALVPVLLGLAWFGAHSVFVAVLAVALATDVLDGFLARRLGVCTEAGAQLDSRADLATWLAVPLCAWWLRPELVAAEAFWIGAGLVSALGATAYGWIRFRRLTSYHTWGAKASAVALGAALFPFLGWGLVLPLHLAIGLLVASQLEEVAITRTLSEWQSDVPSWWHAKNGQTGRGPEAASADTGARDQDPSSPL
ncbi:MAG: CDP-alcohol phosphatidyltransferase family protein [Myxococcales bacterium]|nr:CDP-alcohol phosphatidyltransferase family protein [Myxococcales bacterium]